MPVDFESIRLATITFRSASLMTLTATDKAVPVGLCAHVEGTVIPCRDFDMTDAR